MHVARTKKLFVHLLDVPAIGHCQQSTLSYSLTGCVGWWWWWESFRGLSPTQSSTLVFTSTVFLLLMFSSVFSLQGTHLTVSKNRNIRLIQEGIFNLFRFENKVFTSVLKVILQNLVLNKKDTTIAPLLASLSGNMPEVTTDDMILDSLWEI